MSNNTKDDKTVQIPVKRILMIDDDKFLLEFFGRILNAQGFATVLARNGAEGENLLKNDEKGFDMVILDLLMPVESGWKLIDYLKEQERYKEIPIIALTGLTLSYEEFEKVKKKCSAVMLKGDFEIEHFSNTVYELLMK